MKIKVGNYVRTKGSTYVGSVLEYLNVPRIDRVSCFDTLDKDDYFYLEQDPSTDMYCEEDIIKYGENITDVIEVEDYVNGWKITTIDGRNNKLYAEDEDGYLIRTISKDDIKSVVTKEQMEKMSYKVGGRCTK